MKRGKGITSPAANHRRSPPSEPPIAAVKYPNSHHPTQSPPSKLPKQNHNEPPFHSSSSKQRRHHLHYIINIFVTTVESNPSPSSEPPAHCHKQPFNQTLIIIVTNTTISDPPSFSHISQKAPSSMSQPSPSYFAIHHQRRHNHHKTTVNHRETFLFPPPFHVAGTTFLHLRSHSLLRTGNPLFLSLKPLSLFPLGRNGVE